MVIFETGGVDSNGNLKGRYIFSPVKDALLKARLVPTGYRLLIGLLTIQTFLMHFELRLNNLSRRFTE